MVYTFDTEVAKLVGADAAAIFQNIMFWCAKNKANGQNIHDGRAWTYNSVKAFAELFPWLSADQIRRALKKLEAAGLVMSGSFNKVGYDRTKWYAVGDEGLGFCQLDLAKAQVPFGESATSDLANSQNGFAENTEPIPDVNTVTKPDENKERARAEQRHAFGEFENVMLSDKELARFKAERPDDWQERIESMSCWCAAKGKVYKNYLAALRDWARRDEGASKAGMRGGVVDGRTFDAIGAAIGSQRH